MLLLGYRDYPDICSEITKMTEEGIKAGKRKIYLELAYRVWICRSNNYKLVTIYDKNRINELNSAYDSVRKLLKSIKNP